MLDVTCRSKMSDHDLSLHLAEGIVFSGRLVLEVTVCLCGKCNKIDIRLEGYSKDFDGSGFESTACVSKKASRPDHG
jgi:hypothetical protein